MKIINKQITNLAQMIGCKQNLGRLHEWDEENRLRFVLGEKFTGYYGYNADGERVYKLTGQMVELKSPLYKHRRYFCSKTYYLTTIERLF